MINFDFWWEFLFTKYKLVFENKFAFAFFSIHFCLIYIYINFVFLLFSRSIFDLENIANFVVVFVVIPFFWFLLRFVVILYIAFVAIQNKRKYDIFVVVVVVVFKRQK